MVTIYHNPACGTSRNVLAMIRASGEEPEVIEYLKTPPTRDRLVELILAMAIPPRALLREKGTPYADLGLADESLADDALIDAMIAHTDPHQPAHRRHAARRAALPSLRTGAGDPAGRIEGRFRQGGWRGGPCGPRRAGRLIPWGRGWDRPRMDRPTERGEIGPNDRGRCAAG